MTKRNKNNPMGNKTYVINSKLQASDVVPFHNRDYEAQSKILIRVWEIFENINLDEIKTTIAPPDIVRNIWDKYQAPVPEIQHWVLVTEKAFDGGTHFTIYSGKDVD